MKASIILPAYNEGKNISHVINAVKQAGNYEIIVVDDGSNDNTLDVAKNLGCTCLRLKKNMGKGYACSKGAKIASHENIVFIDSDGQLDAGEIPSLLAHLDKNDIVVGTRSQGDIPIQRRLSNKFAKTVVSAAAGKRLGDVLCGFRAIRKKHFFGLDLRKRRYEFDSEMVIKAARRGYRIKEVPVSVRYGIGSAMPPHESAKVAAYILGQLIRK
jgi:glycosyltransferase involved in cell wall biosynthesis